MVEEEKKTEIEEGKEDSKLKGLFSTKNIIIAAVALFIMPIAAYFLVTKVFHPMADSKQDVSEVKKDEEIKSVFMLDPIIVNIAGTNGTRYLKVTIGLELSDPKVSDEIEKRNPQIVDVLIRVFSSRDIAEVSEPRGRDGIRREIITRLNDLLVSGRLINIYFTEFVIQ